MPEVGQTNVYTNPLYQETDLQPDQGAVAGNVNTGPVNPSRLTASNPLSLTTGTSSSMPGAGFSQLITLELPRLDPDTAAVIIGGIIENAGNISTKSSMSNLTSLFRISEALNKNKVKLYDEKLAKAAEALIKKNAQQISSDVGLGFSTAAAVAGMIGAIFLTLFTAGAGAGAIVAAAIGLTTALMDVTDRILQAQNGGTGVKFKALDGKEKNIQFSFAGMVARITEQCIHDNTLAIPKGLTSEQKEEWISKWNMGWSIVTSLLVAAATIIASSASIFKASKDVVNGARVFSKAVSQETAKVVGGVSESIQMVNEIGGACSMIATGAFGVQIAHITFEQKELDLQKERMDVFSKILSGEIASEQDHITAAAEDLKESFENFANLIANFNQSQSKLTNNS